MNESQAARIPTSVIWIYALPTVGIGYAGILFMVYMMKYATDVLAIAPVTMGLLLGAARIWDGVSDPMAGYLSDRTTSRLGRRRSWMFAALIPLGIGIVMLWTPPQGLGPVALVAWMALALLVYETATTAFVIPHGAFGVELTTDYHERTRLFGYRHVITALGLIVGIGAFALIERAQDTRAAASYAALFGGVLCIATGLYSTARLEERPEFQGRGGVNLKRALGDIARNRYARLLLLIYGVESFGAASIAMLVPYITEYVFDLPGSAYLIVLCYFIPYFLFTPLWITLSRRHGKKRLWLVTLVSTTLIYTGLFFIRDGSSILVWILPTCLGIAGGCGAVVAPSIKADVIDYDEYMTGERKEGSYLAVWNFVRKAAGAIPALFTGVVLQMVDYEQNAEQSEEAKLAMRMLFGLVPAACFAIATMVCLRFDFDEAQHSTIRRALDERSGSFDRS